MTKRKTLTSTLLALTLGSVGVFSLPTQSSEVRYCLNPLAPQPVHKRLKPLGDLIAIGEGDYNSVNRGYAGDTPGGIQRLTGKAFEKHTVGEVVSFQSGWLHAVGRYQMIPVTMRFAIANSDVDYSDMFTPEVQDKLLAALIFHKRPAVGAYLRGEHDSIEWALNELAYEWASFEYRNGRGYYDGIAGNRSKVSRAEVRQVLISIKEYWHKPQVQLT
jgi:hypothetical protein